MRAAANPATRNPLHSLRLLVRRPFVRALHTCAGATDALIPVRRVFRVVNRPRNSVTTHCSGLQGGPFVPWSPTVDGVELQAHPWQLACAGNVTQVPVLHGTNTDEVGR
jgi:hypothetical protein